MGEIIMWYEITGMVVFVIVFIAVLNWWIKRRHGKIEDKDPGSGY